MASPSSALERQPSIDAEPKTLLSNDMKLAREAALKIIENNSKEEALKIFLEGLKPTAAAKPTDTSDNEDEEEIEYKDYLTIESGR